MLSLYGVVGIQASAHGRAQDGWVNSHRNIMSYFALIVLDRFENYFETDDQGAEVLPPGWHGERDE